MHRSSLIAMGEVGLPVKVGPGAHCPAQIILGVLDEVGLPVTVGPGAALITLAAVGLPAMRGGVESRSLDHGAAPINAPDKDAAAPDQGAVGLLVMRGAIKSPSLDHVKALISDDDAPIRPQGPACRRFSGVGQGHSAGDDHNAPHVRRRLSVVSDDGCHDRDDDRLCAYEKERQRNIVRNQAVLKSLGLETEVPVPGSGKMKQPVRESKATQPEVKLSKTPRRNPPRGEHARGHLDNAWASSSTRGQVAPVRMAGISDDSSSDGSDDGSDDSGSNGVVTCNTEFERESADNMPNLTPCKRPFLIMCMCPPEKQSTCPELGYPCRNSGRQEQTRGCGREGGGCRKSMKA